MKKENFTPATMSFEDIIDNSKKYVVPKYQRDYSWSNTNDEWELLWEDIISVAESHYVGILVLQENEKEISIIDGQQRLTTISLIILAILYILSEYAEENSNIREKKNIRDQLDILMQKYIGRKAEDLKYYNKITLNYNNCKYFQEICNIQRYKVFKDIPKPDCLETNKKIHKCLKYYYENIKNYISPIDSEKIIEFIKKNIVNKLIFTTIQVSKSENAYLLFETLNSRSIELTAYDLLKNHLLAKAGQKYEKSMLDDIQQVIYNIENHDITNFIALDWNSRNLPKTPIKRTYRKISSSILTLKDAFSYVHEIKISSEIYKKIKNFDHSDKQIKELLKVLTYLPKVKQHYMILLSLMKTNKYSLVKILKTILNITIKYNYIIQGQANKQENIYNKIAYKITTEQYKTTEDILKDLNCPDLEVTEQEFISKFSKKDFSNNSLDRYILAKIEEYYDPHNKIDYDNETIEHISDKNLEKDYTYKIGNLTLLTVDDNNSLSGKDYDSKRKFYIGHARKIVNTINSPIWDENTVNKRGIELAKIANLIFNKK